MKFCSLLNGKHVILLLLALCAPLSFIQKPTDSGQLNLLPASDSASRDFGNIVFNPPLGILKPVSPEDIAQLLSFISSSSSRVTVAAQGAGHSTHGQAQALNGIVIETHSLPVSIKIYKNKGDSGFSYADVSGGAMWIELLEDSLKEGLTARSWTDYLHLTVAGTLSNAGIGGQTFKHGPQISTVLELDVITGAGDIVTCSLTANPDLFYAVLGGLGQFGIITRARILLDEAPEKVKWVRAFYDDFRRFTRDQELLISLGNIVDYVEGFLILNEGSLDGSSASFPQHVGFALDFHTGGRPSVYFCIEFAIYEYQSQQTPAEQVVEEISGRLSFMPSSIYSAQVSYYDFLNRVRMEEMSLRQKGLWDVPHPWLNIFVPRSGIKDFTDLLLDNISPSIFEGPILMYPFLRDKWDSNTSAVLPPAGDGDGNIVYIVGMLRSATPGVCSMECLSTVMEQNKHIGDTACSSPRIRAKMYLPHYAGEEQWRQHFDEQWERFSGRKAKYDPLCILAPGHGIFQRKSRVAAS